MNTNSLDATDSSADAERLAAHGAELEQLLAELQANIGPNAWPRVELLVRSLMDLYGVALERLLAIASLDATGLAERVIGDDVLSSVLALHGLHPLPLEQRIELGLAAFARRAPSNAARVEVAALEQGRLTLRVIGVDDPLLARSLAQVAARQLDTLAPELTQIELEELAGAPHGTPQLISVERLVSGGRA